METVSKTMTAVALLHGDYGRSELVAGELVTRAPMGGNQGRVAPRLMYALDRFLEAVHIPYELLFSSGFLLHRQPDTVRCANLALILPRSPLGDIPGYYEGAPDLVAEVVSPNDTRPEVLHRIDMWLQAGVRLAWVIDPQRRIAQIFEAGQVTRFLNEDGVLDAGTVLPGFALPLTALFVPKPAV